MIVDRFAAAAAALVLALLALPPAAQAQAPSYATRSETITGTIASVQNVNHIFVADDRGYTDDVTLRAGATMFSDGLRLEAGVRVTIAGSAAGPTFLATRIATSGRAYSVAPVQPPSVYPAFTPVYYAYRPYFPAFYQRYAFGYGYGYGYGPFYHAYGFGYGYSPLYRGFGCGCGPFSSGYGFGYGSFSRGYGWYRPSGGWGVHVHFRG